MTWENLGKHFLDSHLKNVMPSYKAVGLTVWLQLKRHTHIHGDISLLRSRGAWVIPKTNIRGD